MDEEERLQQEHRRKVPQEIVRQTRTVTQIAAIVQIAAVTAAQIHQMLSLMA